MGFCSSSVPPIALSEDDDAAIYFSSGTTGFPKAILHKHRSLTQAAQDGADEGSRQDPLQQAHIDLASPPELPGAHDGAKGSGELIGPDGQMRRQASG